MFTVLNAERLLVQPADGWETSSGANAPLAIDVEAVVPGTAGYMGSSPYAVHYRDLVQTTLETAHERLAASPACLGEAIAEALFRRFARIEELEIRIFRVCDARGPCTLLRLRRARPYRPTGGLRKWVAVGPASQA